MNRTLFSLTLLICSSTCLIASLTLGFTNTSIAAEGVTSNQRIVVALDAEHKQFALDRMRRMLETLTIIQQSLADNTLEKVAQQVMQMKQYTRQHHPAGMNQGIPAAFRQMNKQMNMHWATLMQTTNDPKLVQGEVISIMHTCNACHRTFRIE